MINKQGLWFVTLFSLILVLSIYYVTVKNDDLLSITTSNVENNESSVEATESSVLVSLRVQDEEETMAEMENLQTILLDDTASLQEKNDAYDSLQTLNANKGKEEKLEQKIKDTYQLDSFVKIKNAEVNVTIASKEHNAKIANNIIRSVQEEFDQKMYITVKFQG